MPKIDELVKKLQNQPYETRVKIMWTTVIAAGVIIFLVWIISLKSTIKNINPSEPTPKTSGSSQTTQLASNYATVERIEATANNLKIYFNFNNSTNDILNIPTASNITLSINDQQINPTQITDRQGGIFVQKVLSRTQNFGILIFPKTNGDAGQLIFNQMFFEQNPSTLFNQTISLDFKKLETTSTLRN